MKSLRFINNAATRLLLACIAVQIATAANACWYATYSPMEYYTCQIPTIRVGNPESMTELWHRTLLPDVDTDEISKLLFTDGGYTIEQIRKLKVSPALKKHLTANGGDFVEYVCTMRQVNDQRAQMSNPWYYYYAGEPKSAKLNELADTCLKRINTRYGDRYALLAARALNTLKRYPDLESLARDHRFKDKNLEAIFRPEYAGVLYHMGKYEEAAQIYAKAGKKTSLELCLKKLGQYQTSLNVVARLADYESNYNVVVNKLSTFIRALERTKYYSYDYGGMPTEIGQLIETSRARSTTPGIYQPLWRYAEASAYLIDRNDFAKADSVLALIDTRRIDAKFAKSIRTLRFITQSRLKPYDSKYLSWIASEAEWLIRQSDEERTIKRLIDTHDYYTEDYPEVVELDDVANTDLDIDTIDSESLEFYRDNHYSCLYYSDMLHKAVDVIIAPRMLEHGDTVAALQLIDIVDYANLSDSEVRDADSHGNASACFALECGADVILKAIERSKNPRTDIDRLWNKIGSIRNADRWLDFAGTALLAEARYKEAAKHLEQVSAGYAKERNIYHALTFDSGKTLDPFAAEFRADDQCHQDIVMIAAPSNYKLWFAQKMSQLEDTFSDATLDPEMRAQARLKYGLGMANSVYPCWPLTRYGEGGTIFSPWVNATDDTAEINISKMVHNFFSYNYGDEEIVIDPFARSHRRLSGLRRAGQAHIVYALKQIKDPETMAAYLRSIGHYKTIKRHYANTSVAKALRSKCDTWSMY